MALTFDSIAGGELAEKFKMALAQIGRNIMDPNMDQDAARGMTINLKFKPQKSGVINIEFDVKTKLAGFEKSDTVFLIGQDARTGRIEMTEYGNKEQVTRIEPPAAAYTPAREAAGNEPRYDPSTGEIYDTQNSRGPIDLRAAQ